MGVESIVAAGSGSHGALPEHVPGEILYNINYLFNKLYAGECVCVCISLL